jgi:two-component system chemotaxis response regulator CheY
LIVEDSPLLQKMYGLAFPGRENVLITAASGREALRLVEKLVHCDVILLDLRMPEMNGVEFIKEVRRHPRLKAIPIVVVTAEQEESELLKEARALGVSAVVRKPWKPVELKVLVERVVRPKGPRS